MIRYRLPRPGAPVLAPRDEPRLSSPRSRAARLLLGLLLALAAGGCTSVRLISDYDEVVADSITALQRQTERLLLIIERNVDTTEASYEELRPQHDQLMVELRTIRTRAAAHPRNELTVEQIDLLAENLDRLDQAHEEGFEAREEIELFRSALERQFSAILALELAKKRGES